MSNLSNLPNLKKKVVLKERPSDNPKLMDLTLLRRSQELLMMVKY